MKRIYIVCQNKTPVLAFERMGDACAFINDRPAGGAEPAASFTISGVDLYGDDGEPPEASVDHSDWDLSLACTAEHPRARTRLRPGL